MDDLIKREELLTSQYVHTECYLQENKDRHLDVYKKGWNDALQAVYDNAPTIDAVEVVRCEKCKWRDTRTNDCNNPWANYPPHSVDEDFFCGDGERKTDG